MNSREVNKEIKEQIKPWLKEQGFQRITARNAWRTSEDAIEVLNFQSFNSYNASVMGVTTYSFSVNLGVYYKFTNVRPWANYEELKEPKCPECHAVRSVLKGQKQNETNSQCVWFVAEDGSNLEEVIADAKQEIIELAPDWYEELTNLERALDIFQSRPESYSKSAGLFERLGGLGYSLSRAEIVSFLAIKTGNIPQAINFWKNLKRSEFYQRHQSVIYDAENKIEQLAKIII